ncbi:hypothetical protein MMC18_001471 [Xylographa bjoerkii]|nr:hypothetical protein [Xylographa bjoerkii]
MSTDARTPSGYTSVFTNLQASVSASQYMGVSTLTSYDTYGCASQCNHAPGCVAFNVYVERDPTLDTNASNCPNPPSTTSYQCTLWGAPVSASQASNTGQYRDSFQVAITASNGLPPPSTRKQKSTNHSSTGYNLLSPACTPVPAITNGGFETGALAPWSVDQESAWGWTFGTVQSPGHASAYAFTASLAPNPNHASGYSSILLLQNLHTCPGRNYSIAFDVTFEYATPGECDVQVSVPYGGVDDPSGVNFVPPSGGWVASGDVFTALGTDDLLQVEFSCNNGASNTMQVDNVVVLPYEGNA